MCSTFIEITINGPFGWRIPRWPVHYSWVYLIHFERSYFHARHYLGSTAASLDNRLKRHQSGDGARLMEVIIEAGISWELSRLWRCESPEEARALERKLKHTHGHGPALCPICRGRQVDVFVSLRQGHWPLALHEKRGRHHPMSTSKPPLFVRIERQVIR